MRLRGMKKCIPNYDFCQNRNKYTNTKANTHIVIKTTKIVLHESYKGVMALLGTKCFESKFIYLCPMRCIQELKVQAHLFPGLCLAQADFTLDLRGIVVSNRALIKVVSN